MYKPLPPLHQSLCQMRPHLNELIPLPLLKSSESIYGFFFTEAPGADVVLVGRSCLELCEFAARRRGLRRVEFSLPIMCTYENSLAA